MSEAADLVRLAMALPGVVDYPHFDRRAFKARVTFVTLASDGLSANFKFSLDEQALKCAVAPDAFAPIPNSWGRRGWTCATLAALSEASSPPRLKSLGVMARRRRRSERRGGAEPRTLRPPRGAQGLDWVCTIMHVCTDLYTIERMPSDLLSRPA